jgi:hypothetical protein
MPQRKQPTPGEIVTMASAAFVLLAAFLPFYEANGLGARASWNAWSDAFLIFPLVPVMVVLCVVLGVLTGLRAFGATALPRRMLGFTFEQLNVAASVLVAITLLTYFLRDAVPDKGAGLIIMFLAGIGMVVGAFVQRTQTASSGYGPYG